jgi:uncharacterized protein (TIGR02246 family)
LPVLWPRRPKEAILSTHPLKHVIEAADRAITAEDFDAVMDFYADDATLVIKSGMTVTGKPAIRRAFDAIAEYFKHSLLVKQGEMIVLEGGGTALVLMDSILEFTGPDGAATSITRRATFVFRQDATGKWLCVIDNSYGTDLLTEDPHV